AGLTAMECRASTVGDRSRSTASHPAEASLKPRDSRSTSLDYSSSCALRLPMSGERNRLVRGRLASKVGPEHGVDPEAPGRGRGGLAHLVRAEEKVGTDGPGREVMVCLGAEETDVPQYFYKRLGLAGAEPSVGSWDGRFAGDQFQAQQFDLVAAEYQV